MQEIVFLPFIYSLRIHPDPFLSTTKIVPVGSTRVASPRLITPRQRLPQQCAGASPTPLGKVTRWRPGKLSWLHEAWVRELHHFT